MAQASKTDDPRERAVSSEPCSTRPNPFDDSEISSRKRRRTSAGGTSRSRSVETDNSTQDLDSVAPAPAGDSDPHANSDSAMKIDSDPIIPTTPEQQQAQPVDVDGRPTPSEPRSSRVTINVRTPSRPPLDAIPSSPSSPTSPIPSDPVAATDDVKISVEGSEVDMTGEDTVLDTPVSSNSDASSPPVELVTIQLEDDDEVVDFGFSEPPVTILDGIPRALLHDPSEEFPFRDANESFIETVNRLSTYMTTHETVCSGIADWIGNYLLFAKTAPPGAVMESYREHREMWQAVPDLVLFMINRKSSYPRSIIRQEIFRFYKAFAKLTAFFIELDLKSLRAWAEDQPRLPDLASPYYISSLAGLTRKDEIQFYASSQYANLEDDFSYAIEVVDILDTFGTYPTSHGGSLAYMKNLGQIYARLVPRFPKLTEHLASLAVLTSNMMYHSYRRLNSPSLQVIEHVRGNLSRGFAFFKAMAPALDDLVEKHVNHFSYDGASNLVVALMDTYHFCLSTDNIVPAEFIREHRLTHPPVGPNLLAEAMAARWKFGIFAKLIMSSQMQLRVMAATLMCGDLVNFYRRFSEQADDPNPAFLSYIADFLLKSGLVAYLLSAKCHPEVTTESSNIVGFLLVSQTYTPQHTDTLWATVTSTQDPRISDALIKMISRIANLFSPEALMYLCEKMQTIPVESFSTTMREFCDGIFRNLLPKHHGLYDRQITNSAPYDLCIRLIRQASKFGSQSPTAYPEIHQFAVQKFRDLVACGITPESRRNIYIDCLSDIAQKTSTTIGSLWVLYLVTRTHTGREIAVLTGDHNLTTLLIEELEAAIPAALQAGFPAVLSGTHNLPRKDLLFNVLACEASMIPKDLGPKFWHLLVGPGAACREDRDVGWYLLNNAMKGGNGMNSFASTCFSEYMPTLPPECFCLGTHEFVREGIIPLVNDIASIALDDEEDGDHPAIEQLWRLILTAPQGTIENQAIVTLVSDVYLKSETIKFFPHHRARKVHLALVNRCLQQLSTAATTLKSFGNQAANGDDDSMVMVATDQQVLEQELLFIRSLSVLREFHTLHQAEPHFSAPDLRPIMSVSPEDVQGESAELKYQSFDGDAQTDVKPLNIGMGNTAASLFATLREATGFENYRLYYRGRPFAPQESDIRKSLEDLQMHDGIILVRREPDVPSSPTRARPGASRVEVEILGHFEELWEYLSMEEKLAREIYAFLVKLPIDEDTLESIENPSTSYQSIFSLGQPYKTMYAVHALREYHESQQTKFATDVQIHDDAPDEPTSLHTKSLNRIMSLVVSAISDPEVISQCPSVELQLQLGARLVECLGKLLDSQLPASIAPLLDGLLLDRLLNIMSASLSADISYGGTRHLTRCLESIFRSCSLSIAFMSAFCTHPEIPRLFENLLLRDSRFTMRLTTARLIMGTIGADLGTSDPDPTTAKFRGFFWPLVSGLIGAAISPGSQSDQCLELCLKMFRTLRLARSPILDIPQLLADWGRLVLSYTTTEDLTQPDDTDEVAAGLIKLLHCLMCGDDRPTAQEVQPSRGMAQKLFWKHLFPDPSIGTGPSRPILTTSTRTALLEIMMNLVEDDPKQISLLIDDLNELVPVYPDDEDFYAYDLTQQFDRQKSIKSSCGYVGLRNLSNTCYFNSLLTQLFMNTGFRQFVLNATVQDSTDAQSLLFATQKMFAFMQGTLRRSVNPEDVVSSIKTYEDTQIDIHNQMDVDEFYNLLFDRWEGQLVSDEEKRQFRSLYGGQLVQQVTSKECEHISERLEPFSAIQCDIKGKTSLEESLQAYVDGEIMEGDNKYKCSTCDRHVDAVKRACLKDIPDNLIFHLKRFDFNLRTLMRNKINDYFAFPTTIDMQPYTIEHLSGREDQPKDVFELVGVLVHSGTAESGHYYSFVRERPSSSDAPVWVEFNDESVSQWDAANMENCCFGGPDVRTQFENNSVNYDKTYSAYMLFYQRSTSLVREQELLRQSGRASPFRANVPYGMGAAIENENNQLLRRHCLYDPVHIKFVQSALSRMKSANQDKCSRSHETENVAMTMALSHLDQVASRTKEIPDFYFLHKHISEMCRSCVRCSLAAYEYFYQYTEALRMLVQRNVDMDVRQATVSLVIRVLQSIKARLPDQYGLPGPDADDEIDEDDEQSVIHGMMRIFRCLWDHFHMNLRSWPEVFDLMYLFVKQGRSELATFLQQPYLKYLLMIVHADPSVDLQPQFARMLSVVSRRAATRPPSYDRIIDLINILIGSMHLLTTERGDFAGLDSPEQRMYRYRTPDGRFCFTKAELKILQLDWTRSQSSVFLEKLISINQNHPATYQIIANLIKYGDQMEERVSRTLRHIITGQVGQTVNGPFLRVAAFVFCRFAARPDLIREMITHVSALCMALQNVEGKAFLDFQREVFSGPRENSGEDPEEIMMAGYKNLPNWAPGLLGYFDSSVSADTEAFLQEKVFKYGPSPVFDDTEQGRRRADVITETGRVLGLRCLEYLADNFVNGRGDVSMRLVAGLQRVIKESSRFFSKDTVEDEAAREFARLSQMTLEPLRRIVVDDVEDDGSEWDGSSACSEQPDSLGDISMPAASDLNDGD